MAENTGAWLTQDAFDRLTQELEYLSGPYRQEIVDRIAQARDEGDLRENGGYHAARDEQAKNEARIKQLKHLLETAHIGDAPVDDGVVALGMVIEAEVAARHLGLNDHTQGPQRRRRRERRQGGRSPAGA